MHGSGYDYASVTMSGGAGTGATARAVLSPVLGFGGDPRDDLKSSAIMFNSKPNGTESGKFFVDNDFRQVGLWKNPLDSAAGNLYTAASGIASRQLKFASVPSPVFTPDNTLVGGTSGALGYVISVDSDIVYYSQNDSSGYTSFTLGETITEQDGSGSGVLDSSTQSDINIFKGDLLYIDNRAAVQRDAAQTEDLKIVIQL